MAGIDSVIDSWEAHHERLRDADIEAAEERDALIREREKELADSFLTDPGCLGDALRFAVVDGKAGGAADAAARAIVGAFRVLAEDPHNRDSIAEVGAAVLRFVPDAAAAIAEWEIRHGTHPDFDY